ncbi:MAG: (d)CMP kinase [Crocinitomicaceae bacterium]|nr:(d)CMP kinase [Crocinitomicaceae bacterium]
MQKKITIAIDGYAGCGKSTLAKALAKALNYTFIDSGAMYRAVAFYCLEQGFISDDDEIDSTQLLQQLDQISINLSSDQKVWLNNQDITEVIRSPKVAGVVSKVAAIKAVRTKLVELQRQMSVGGGIVMDGRDIGTVVFPDAELKIFVTASIEVRTQRRLAELKAKGEDIDEVAVQQNLLDRDHQDSTRAESPLKQAAEAVVLDTSALNREEQLAWALARVALLVVTD